MSSSSDRIASALERIAATQEKLLENCEKSLELQRRSLYETEEQTSYLLRSEKQRNSMDAFARLFYLHSFKKDGFDFVQDGERYSTVPLPLEEKVALDDEIKKAYENLYKLLDKKSSKTTEVP